jgi:predicted nucleic acid-binding protein
VRPLVLDAAAVVDVLLDNEPGQTIREHLHGASLFSVAHLDAEVLSALGRIWRNGEISAADVSARLELLAELALERMDITAVLTAAAWEMRDNVVLRDGLYVAAAQLLGGVLLTTDGRLRRAAPELTLDPATDPPR